jgi:hypothetical protein
MADFALAVSIENQLNAPDAAAVSGPGVAAADSSSLSISTGTENDGNGPCLYEPSAATENWYGRRSIAFRHA